MEHPALTSKMQRAIDADRLRFVYQQRRLPARQSVNPLREIAGRALMNIGARIAARPRPIDGAMVTGESPLTGHADT